MTRFILIVACVCVAGAFAGKLSAGSVKHVAAETLSPSAMTMQMDTRSLPVEAFDTI